jgi:hypothetical protein
MKYDNSILYLFTCLFKSPKVSYKLSTIKETCKTNTFIRTKTAQDHLYHSDNNNSILCNHTNH